MTTWTAADADLRSWDDAEHRLLACPARLTVAAGRDGPLVAFDAGDWSGGGLLVADPRGRLRAQDRRRLHRLGLRPVAGARSQAWLWVYRASGPADGASAGELAHLLTALREVDLACRAQLVAVLRDGLRLQPAQLVVLAHEEEEEEVDEEPADDVWDDAAWADEWGDVG